ncbi:MAG: hypothetical protein MZU97_03360 [Bacillus subtilis]|nr:hypothetical protein [Bacillus subtilis]
MSLFQPETTPSVRQMRIKQSEFTIREVNRKLGLGSDHHVFRSSRRTPRRARPPRRDQEPPQNGARVSNSSTASPRFCPPASTTAGTRRSPTSCAAGWTSTTWTIPSPSTSSVPRPATKPKTKEVKDGNFYLSKVDGNLVTPIVDMDLIYGADTAMNHASAFANAWLRRFDPCPAIHREQGSAAASPPSSAPSMPANRSLIHTLIGYVSDIAIVNEQAAKMDVAWFEAKREEARHVTSIRLLDDVWMKSGNPIFDEYVRPEPSRQPPARRLSDDHRGREEGFRLLPVQPQARRPRTRLQFLPDRARILFPRQWQLPRRLPEPPQRRPDLSENRRLFGPHVRLAHPIRRLQPPVDQRLRPSRFPTKPRPNRSRRSCSKGTRRWRTSSPVRSRRARSSTRWPTRSSPTPVPTKPLRRNLPPRRSVDRSQPRGRVLVGPLDLHPRFGRELSARLSRRASARSVRFDDDAYRTFESPVTRIVRATRRRCIDKSGATSVDHGAIRHPDKDKIARLNTKEHGTNWMKVDGKQFA